MRRGCFRAEEAEALDATKSKLKSFRDLPLPVFGLPPRRNAHVACSHVAGFQRSSFTASWGPADSAVRLIGNGETAG